MWPCELKKNCNLVTLLETLIYQQIFGYKRLQKTVTFFVTRQKKPFFGLL